VAYVGMVIMQRSRPGDCCFEPLFKALHHLSCQLLHVQIAFRVLLDRVGTQFQAVEIPPPSPLFINKLVGFESP
jgi:hypothetical protein